MRTANQGSDWDLTGRHLGLPLVAGVRGGEIVRTRRDEGKECLSK